MLDKRKVLAVGVAFIVALVIGYLMQIGDDLDSRISHHVPEIQLIQSAKDTQFTPLAKVTESTGQPPEPTPILFDKSLPVLALADKTGLAGRFDEAEQDYSTPYMGKERGYSPFGLVCDVSLSAIKTVGAMVMLDLKAPCHADETVTIRHGALAFSATTSDVGRYRISVPALTKNAVFDVELQGGETISSSMDVPEVSDFDRAAIQWTGKGDLKIHALELGAGSDGNGHVWANPSQSAERVLHARGGFIARLGSVDIPDAKHAEVYSFPTGRAHKFGVIRLSVEAEVTALTCGKEIDAQVLQRETDGGISVVDLTLLMPTCDAIGEFLVLNSLLRDIKIAQN